MMFGKANSRGRESYERDFQEAMEAADLINLEDAIADISHENNLRRNVAFKRLRLGGEHSLALLIEVLRNRDPERLGTALELLSEFYLEKKFLHPDFARLLFEIVRSDLPVHITRVAIDILAMVACEEPSTEIHDYFMDLFFCEDTLLQTYAINYLVHSSHDISIPLLTLVLKEGENWRLVEVARHALKQLKRGDARFALWEWEKSKD